MLRKVLYVCAMFSLASLSGYADTEFDGCKNCLACDKCPDNNHLLAHHGEGDHDHDDDQDEDESEDTKTV